MVVTSVRDYGGGLSLIKEITYRETKTVLINKTSLKAEVKIMDRGDIKM
jgi:hypothetical protein